MTTDDIKKLVSADESRTLELKKTTGELKDGMHSACAFLNTEGGWLIFGVAPKSLKIIGQEVTDRTQQEVALIIRSRVPRKSCHKICTTNVFAYINLRCMLGKGKRQMAFLSPT